MESSKLFREDEHGLFDTENYPYVALKLTQKEASEFEYHIPVWYTIDGTKLIPVRDVHGNETGEFMCFIMMLPIDKVFEQLKRK